MVGPSWGGYGVRLARGMWPARGHWPRWLLLAGLVPALVACGEGRQTRVTADIARFEQDANLCAPDNPLAHTPAGGLLDDYRAGSRSHELRFVRHFMQATYLWPEQIPPADPDAPAFQSGPFLQAISDFFSRQLSTEQWPDGFRKDRFSSVVTTSYWQRLNEAGVHHDFGMLLARLSDRQPRDIRIALVYEGSAAARAGLQRGDRLLAVELPGGPRLDLLGPLDAADEKRLMQLLQARAGEGPLLLQVRRADGSEHRVSLQASRYARAAVPVARILATGQGKVGYLMVDAFSTALEGAMQAAFARFEASQVQDLVVDLRYNGGGQLSRAAQLAYMVADPQLSQGRVFERLIFNPVRQADYSAWRTRQLFISTSTGLPGSGTRVGQPLPNLGLRRVYVLTGPGSCSASESFINGLKGIDVQVIQIGAASCGKPYGSIPRDNCGLTYLPVQFRGVNDKGEGDYIGGIRPDCPVADTLSGPLGEPAEALLAAALHHRTTGQCPVGIGQPAAKGAGPVALQPLPQLLRHPGLEIKVLMP